MQKFDCQITFLHWWDDMLRFSSTLQMKTLMQIENNKLSKISFKQIVFYLQLRYLCNIFLTCSISKVLTCFGFTECKQIQLQLQWHLYLQFSLQPPQPLNPLKLASIWFFHVCCKNSTGST